MKNTTKYKIPQHATLTAIQCKSIRDAEWHSVTLKLFDSQLLSFSLLMVAARDYHPWLTD